MRLTLVVVALSALVAYAGSVWVDVNAAETSGRSTWFLMRASGLGAYALLALSTIWGLLTSSRLLMKWVNLPLAAELHQMLSLLGLVLTAFHGWVLLFDVEYGFTLTTLLVPFASPFRPIAVGAGVIAAYLMALLALTSSVGWARRRMGQRTWRWVHYSAFAAFVLGLAHGLFAGSDTAGLGAGMLYTVSGGLVLFLTYVRILGGRYVPQRKAPPVHPRAGAAGTVPPAPASNG
jgi:sulfoxide reductase heme-binding subunit YedZ